jgi:hypothetical protein
MPTASAPYTPESADLEIRRLTASLVGKGIPVFSATGNIVRKPVDYPACIFDTTSVSVGSLNKFGSLVVAGAADDNTDLFVPLGGHLVYTSPVMGRIPNTTSSATVASAVQWLLGNARQKFVNVLQ